jgi:hypothetical protein
MYSSPLNHNFHTYLFSGKADFTILNTRTGNGMHYNFLSVNDGIEFILYCVEVNGRRCKDIGTMGKFVFSERQNVDEPVKYKFVKMNKYSQDYTEDVESTMEFKTFIYLLEHKRIPDFIRIHPITCGNCGCLIDNNRGFCNAHKGTIENLFDVISYWW